MTSPFTVGVVGAGGIANPHAAAWKALGAHIAVYSEDDGAPALAERYGGTVSPDLDALLQAASIVDICTPPFAHAQIAIAAAEAGCHVICEKPLARHHEDGVAMIEACEKAGVALYPAHVVRFTPQYVAAKTAVDNGRIGKPAVLRFSRRGGRPSRPWFSDVAQSGGVVVDLIIHDMDFARWIAGDVTRVYAKVLGGEGGPTTAYVLLTHESGALSHITGHWGHASTVFRTGYSLSGATGLVEYDSAAGAPLSWDLADTAGAAVAGLSYAESPYLTELREFLEAIHSGHPPRVSAQDGLAALDLALAALESSSTGRAVTLAEVAR